MTGPSEVTPEDIVLAAARLSGLVRRTPLLDVSQPTQALGPGGPIFLKLESMQRSGSFKLRGALNAALTLDPRPTALVTASGGNHGAGLACAGAQVGLPVEVYVPKSTPPDKRARLVRLGARVHVTGEVWDDADAAAREATAAGEGAYVHPFADPAVIAGNGTVALEILADLPDVACVVIAVGGGGLIGGCARAIKAARPEAKVIGVEPRGAPTLSQSLAANALVTLPEITTRAGSLAPRRSAELNLKLARQFVDEVVLVSDEELEAGVAWLRSELGVAAELGGAASLAAVLSGRFVPPREGPTCLVICGAG
ncbi:MAG: pyridoxal-phosphate dependent enzyme [Planctomycetes bacterium]|nr:pyridoxal-phosphate dependent enzyme [Planctomycetota bacterium]